MTGLGAQVECVTGFIILKEIQCLGMGCGKVANMDIVPYTASVFGGIFVAEHGKGAGWFLYRLQYKGDEVRFRFMVFADFALGIGTSGVEIP